MADRPARKINAKVKKAARQAYQPILDEVADWPTTEYNVQGMFDASGTTTTLDEATLRKAIEKIKADPSTTQPIYTSTGPAGHTGYVVGQGIGSSTTYTNFNPQPIPHVKIQLAGNGYGTKVWLDGVEITRLVEVKVEADPHGPPRITLVMFAQDGDEIELPEAGGDIQIIQRPKVLKRTKDPAKPLERTA